MWRAAYRPQAVEALKRQLGRFLDFETAHFAGDGNGQRGTIA